MQIQHPGAAVSLFRTVNESNRIRNRICLRSITTLGLVYGLMVATATAADIAAPLSDAMKSKDLATVRALIHRGADVNAAQVDGMTPLHWAVYHDEIEITKLLIAAGADVKALNRYGVCSLYLACKNGNPSMVKLLLDSGSDAKAILAGGETLLMTAARTGNPGTVKVLLDHGVDVNTKERAGQTALMWAAAEGHTSVVDMLIAAGADFRQALPSGFTAWFFAVRQGHTDTVSRLLAAGIDIDQPMQPDRSSKNRSLAGTSPLTLAVENGHFQLAVALLEAGAEANDDQIGYTALHAITGVRKPLRGDGDPPPVGSGTITSLELVRQLVSHGANVNARHGKHFAMNGKLNRKDATPLLLAAETGDVPLMRLLVELGADPRLTNADHCTPLLAAAGVGVLGDGDESAGTEADAIEAIALLLDLGSDINAVDDQGNTAMHGAAYKSWNRLVVFLADNGADPDVWNQKNKRGWTPLMIAQGHRPGNFRPSPQTVATIQLALKQAKNVSE